ncbi:MAG: IS630 family transposase [Myxococcales bacterium]
MPGPQAIKVIIPEKIRAELEAAARMECGSHRDVVRARIVLLAEQGLTNPEIARRAGCTERNVYRWRTRFALNPSMDSLKDRGRTGRPARVGVDVRCGLIKLACERPDKEKAPLRDVWTHAALRAALEAETGERIGLTEIGRILKAAELRPHRVRYWLHSPDPDFRPMVQRICDLYVSPPPGASVVCIDEKTCIQALERKHLGRPAAPGREGRREFEYIRHGTRALIAAFDVRTGKVFGQLRKRRTAADLDAFMEALARRYPRGPVYVIWDNLNIHHGDAWVRFNKRHGGRFHFVYTPKHASWVNQVEIRFGILQRRIIKNANFATPEAMVTRIEDFIRYWNDFEAHPFRWTFRGRFHDDGSRHAA